MRRYKSSCLPALPSKDHFPALFTNGTGKGQSSLPTSRNARVPVFGSTETLFFSRASAAKSMARWRSCAKSPVNATSSAAGPKISVNALTSNFAAASMSASAACCGVSNSLALEGNVRGTVRTVLDALPLAGVWAVADEHDHATALMMTIFAKMDFMLVLLRFWVLRYAVLICGLHGGRRPPLLGSLLHRRD